jgi:DNA-directed RNA polymerase specialized sigma24 family protein
VNTSEANSDDAVPLSSGNFAPTRWTQVLRARGETAEAQAALGELCAAYWQPVFDFIRRDGRDEDAARDLTQEFFARLLARRGLDTVEPGRGRFRSFLLGAVKHFLADQHAHAHAAKRGAGHVPISIEAGPGTDTTAGLQIPDPTGPVSDMVFDRQWALTLVDRAVARLAADFAAEGKQAQFDALKPWLLGEVASLSQADSARQLGLSEGAVKVAVHRLRKRFRELVKAEIAQTVNGADEVQDELRYLVETLSHQP